ncbi:hypothetical protein GR316_05380 [Falsirhodobacter algicola]|uniref:Hedgehog/Intein (Hint) domain-containing protein n=2 Tax=Falsirhodobacter algicola TaxID=2692330 RepID=A0A8J8SLZ4_9RHOB|nr:hypothetical protein GR316_05380 [Falsirhodobacter algicola]
MASAGTGQFTTSNANGTFTAIENIVTGGGSDVVDLRNASSSNWSVTTGAGNDDLLVNVSTDTTDPVTINFFGGADDDDPATSERDRLILQGIEGGKRAINLDNVTTNADGSYSGFVTVGNRTINFENVESILCFTPGAMIQTLGGARPVETLKIGDMVMTRDNGLQPIRWIGQTTVKAEGRFAPIRIRKAMMPELTADLVVSPQHRMLIEGYRAELLFGSREVLVAAKHLVDDACVTVEEGGAVTYVHMLFDQHEVVMANGVPTESFHPASYGISGMGEEAREELFALFPDLRALPDSYGDTARRVLKAFEVKALIA